MKTGEQGLARSETPISATPVLETERLVLRPISADDHPALYLMFNDPEVRRYLWDDKPVSFEATRSVAEASVRDFSERGVGLFALRPRDAEEELVGLCGLRWEEGVGEMEIMYCLLPELWGRGLATEAAKASLRFAFEQAKLERVLGGADEPNAASLRVIGRLGMRSIDLALPGAPKVPYFEIERDDFLRSDANGNLRCPGQQSRRSAARMTRCPNVSLRGGRAQQQA